MQRKIKIFLLIFILIFGFSKIFAADNMINAKLLLVVIRGNGIKSHGKVYGYMEGPNSAVKYTQRISLKSTMAGSTSGVFYPNKHKSQNFLSFGINENEFNVPMLFGIDVSSCENKGFKIYIFNDYMDMHHLEVYDSIDKIPSAVRYLTFMYTLKVIKGEDDLPKFHLDCDIFYYDSKKNPIQNFT